jgi:endonuclease-8
MPEGPEVKIMSEYLNDVLSGQDIVSISCISKPYHLKYGDLVSKIQSFLPISFNDSFCIGKATFIPLSDNMFLSYHLGMSGFWSLDLLKHAHLQISTRLGTNFYFHDTRRFGNIKLLSKSEIEMNYFKNSDFLNFDTNPDVYGNYLFQNLRTNLEVCKILLNQRYFSGIGNYLKSEILYLTGIHPHQKWSDLSLANVQTLCRNAKSLLFKSYAGGGAQLRDFKNPGRSPDLKLLVYGRAFTDENTPVISSITRDNRRSFWCQKTQKI